MNEQNRVSLKEKWKRYRLNHSAQSIAASAALYLLLFLCAMAIFFLRRWSSRMDDRMPASRLCRLKSSGSRLSLSGVVSALQRDFFCRAVNLSLIHI